MGTKNGAMNALAFSEWLHDADKFVEILLLLVHLTSGQPTRGSEVTSTTIVNKASGGIRGVYWCNKTVMITQYYNKSTNVHGDKFIARFLPNAISKLMVVYLIIVRTMER
jgi:hypothetical protein